MQGEEFVGKEIKMNIAINTDILSSTGDPEMILRLIAEAGFTHLHWCHHWASDFAYCEYEWAHYESLFKKYNLLLLDIHGSANCEKCWWSPVEYCRKAGVLHVKNRAETLARLGGTGALMMHIPSVRYTFNEEQKEGVKKLFDQVRKSIDELMPDLEKLNVRLAIENNGNDTFEHIGILMKEYPADRVGITYDSGHGNAETCRGLDNLEQYKDRLMALHLNDNAATGDPHQPPYMGTVDWDRVTSILAASSYDKPLSFELSMRNTPFFKEENGTEQKEEDIKNFLADTYRRCAKVHALYEEKKKQISK